MSGIFPLREAVDLGDDRDPRLIDLDEDVADEVFDALSSRTTREIFAQLHASPQTASDLAEVTDTSVQNAQYHLQKLIAADLVEVVDTWYSERGTEMKVYAPTDESLVLFAGRNKEGALRTLLKRVVGVLVALLPVSAVVAWLADRFAGPRPETGFQSETAGDAGGDAGAADAAEETPEPEAGTEAAVEGDSGDGGGVSAADAESGGGDGGGGDGGGGGADATPSDAGAGGGEGGDAVTPTGDAPTPKSETLDAAGNATLQANTSGTVNESTPAPEAVDVAGTTPSPNPTDQATEVVAEVTPTPNRAMEATDVAVEAAGTGIDPALVAGLSFFFGGVFVLVLVGVAWYWRS